MKLKNLVLHCHCGTERRFSGADTDALLAAIDDSGWNDRAHLKASKAMPLGHCCGVCPTCTNNDANDPRQ